MSRMTAALLLATSQAPPQGNPSVTAEQVLSAHRAAFKPPRELDCPKREDEIVVCARREGDPQPERLPLPVEREPGARIAGEPLNDSGGCIRLCHQPVAIGIVKAGKAIASGINRILEGDE
jgi:hypothetical protein